MLISDEAMRSCVPLPLADIVGKVSKPVAARSGDEAPKDAADVGARAEGADEGVVGSIAAVLRNPLDPQRGM